MYDRNGEQVDARDVLTDDELAGLHEGEQSSRAPHEPIFPTLDEDGYDRAGWAWGARTYGAAS